MEWQPVETIPRDRPVLVWNTLYERMQMAQWREDRGKPGWTIYPLLQVCSSRYWTHWMPLPPPPEDGGGRPE